VKETRSSELTSTAVSPGLLGCFNVLRSLFSRSENVFSMRAYCPSSDRSSWTGRLKLPTKGKGQLALFSLLLPDLPLRPLSFWNTRPQLTLSVPQPQP